MAPLLALVLLLIPLAIVPGWFFYFDVTPKTVVLVLGTAAAAIWWAALGSRRVPRWFSALMGAMTVSLVASTIASGNRNLSLGGSNWRFWGLVPQLAALGFAWLVAASCAGRPDRTRTLLRAVTLGGLPVAGYGIAQYFGYDPLLNPAVYHVGEGIYTIVRPPSTLGHADYFADWLLFVIFAAAALVLSEKAQLWKWLAGTSIALSMVAVILSGTRAAMAGLAAGAILLMLWRGFRPTRRAAAAALAIAVAGAIFYLSPAGAMLRARVHWVLQEPAGGARLLLWRDTLRMALARWPLGYGPETFAGAFAQHKSAGLARAFPDFYYESPHNILLDALVSQGIAGVLLLLALCAVGFVVAWKARGNPCAAALAAGLAALTIGGQFVCFIMPTALAYYVTIALLISLAPMEGLTVGRRWLRLAAARPCAAALILFGVRLAWSETAFAAVRRDLNAGLIGDAAREYAAAPRGGPGVDLWYSRRLAQFAGSGAAHDIRVQAFQDAVWAARRATETDDAPFNAYYNLAAVYASQNDFLRTEAALRATISYAPNWFKPHWMLAQVLAAGGRRQEAEVEAAHAADLDGGMHPEVAATLARLRAHQ
jgi:O-antigen ligase